MIAGENPYVEELRYLCIAQGYKIDYYYIEDLDDQDILDQMVRDATRCDIFIETLNESPASKLWLIEGVEPNLRERTPLLSNCLSASATEVASWCVNPQRVVGFGLIPPIKTPAPIEFVPALQTDFQSTSLARDFWEKLGFSVVRVPDTPGLVRARIVCSVINEAVFALDQLVANAEDIDRAMKLGMSFPRGPLSWADEIGLDVVLGTLTAMYEYWGEDRYRPAPLLKQKVRAGHLGKKSGRGFFIEANVEPDDTEE